MSSSSTILCKQEKCDKKTIKNILRCCLLIVGRLVLWVAPLIVPGRSSPVGSTANLDTDWSFALSELLSGEGKDIKKDMEVRIEKLEEELKSEKAKSDVLLEQQRLIKMGMSHWRKLCKRKNLSPKRL